MRAAWAIAQSTPLSCTHCGAPGAFRGGRGARGESALTAPGPAVGGQLSSRCLQAALGGRSAALYQSAGKPSCERSVGDGSVRAAGAGWRGGDLDED